MMMKTNWMNLALIGALLATDIAAAGDASRSPENLSTYLSEEITSVDEAVRNELSGSGGSHQGSPSDDSTYFRRFWLRIRPKVGIDIPGLADFEIIPETELLWEKTPPAGWDIYKP